MGKLVLLSVLGALVVIPVLASRDQVPARALKRTVFFTLLFNAFYAFAALFVYPRLG